MRVARSKRVSVREEELDAEALKRGSMLRAQPQLEPNPHSKTKDKIAKLLGNMSQRLVGLLDQAHELDRDYSVAAGGMSVVGFGM
jgi:hypothetical protein